LHYPWCWHFALYKNSEFSFWKKRANKRDQTGRKSDLDNLYSKPQCHVVSKAFSISKNTAAVDIVLLKLGVTWSISFICCNVVLWHALKPNWLALIRRLSLICFWRAFRITFSNSFPVVSRRLIGRKFRGNFESLPIFGNVMNFASFQDFWKWDSWCLWLIKFVNCTNGRLGRCLRHSFGMPSIPQDFLNFKDLISFCKSHGLILSRGPVKKSKLKLLYDWQFVANHFVFALSPLIPTTRIFSPNWTLAILVLT
jgi:hypothetical protein